MMCAFEAGRRGRRVLLLDHAEAVGKKILISGGGRANFTNLSCRAENYLSENPHFAKSALARFTPADMVALVERHGIAYHEKTLGQLFCDRTARDLVNLLVRECGEAKVRIETSTKILAVTKAASAGSFQVEGSKGSFTAESLVVATGGLSIPKMGATGIGYQLAEQFGIKVIAPRPALVPLLFTAEDTARWADLAGLSTAAVAYAGPLAGASTVKAAKPSRLPSFREKILITHRGLSGPAILQISSYWRPGEAIALDLAPDDEVTAPLLAANARREPATALAALRMHLPARFAERWMAVHPPSGWTNAALAEMEQHLHRWRITPAGTEGYAKAEVTAGGVDTAELDARSMESRRVPGLYFIGEVVDVTGWLGGYNFQWAWASAYSAGQAV